MHRAERGGRTEQVADAGPTNEVRIPLFAVAAHGVLAVVTVVLVLLTAVGVST